MVMIHDEMYENQSSYHDDYCGNQKNRNNENKNISKNYGDNTDNSKLKTKSIVILTQHEQHWSLTLVYCYSFILHKQISLANLRRTK